MPPTFATSRWAQPKPKTPAQAHVLDEAVSATPGATLVAAAAAASPVSAGRKRPQSQQSQQSSGAPKPRNPAVAAAAAAGVGAVAGAGRGAGWAVRKFGAHVVSYDDTPMSTLSKPLPVSAV